MENQILRQAAAVGASQPDELLMFLGRQPRTLALVDVCLLHPATQAGLGDPEVRGDSGDRLGLLPRQLHRPLPKLCWICLWHLGFLRGRTSASV